MNDQSKRRILFVDDEPMVLKGLQRSLRKMRAEWEMRFLTSSKKALEILSAEPIDVIVSTYVTFMKAVRRSPIEKQSGRTEPLIIMGPYKHIRHPIYFSVSLLLIGCWMLLDYSFLFFSALFLLLWFKFIVIPFEEKELVAIFGDQYLNYAKDVPGLIPFIKHNKTEESK